MKILALDKVGDIPTSEQDIKRLIQTEAKQIWDLKRDGLIRETYFRQDRPGTVLVLECESVEEARQIIQSLPLVQAGLTDFELIPLGHYAPLDLLLRETK